MEQTRSGRRQSYVDSRGRSKREVTSDDSKLKGENREQSLKADYYFPMELEKLWC